MTTKTLYQILYIAKDQNVHISFKSFKMKEKNKNDAQNDEQTI